MLAGHLERTDLISESNFKSGVNAKSEEMSAGAYPEIWIRGREGVGSRPLPSLKLPSLPVPLHLPLPFTSLPLPLAVGPLNPARGFGGAL